MQKNEIRTLPKNMHKINSKWIKDLSVISNINLLEVNTGRILFDINHSKIFFNELPRAMKTNTKINK